jgi:predicted kinase
MRVLIITGLAGSGKTTLAHLLARRYTTLLLSKDGIKEPLLDVLGAGDGAHSRLLSDASFAVLFAVARAVLAAGLDVILEGNFRPGEHEAMLPMNESARIVQVLCRVDEPARLARIAHRQQDESRHAGHGDALATVTTQRSGDAFLALPGERVTFDGGENLDARHLEALDERWRGI